MATMKPKKPNVALQSRRNKPRKAAYFVPSIFARAGHVEIQADEHGCGFTCTVDGRPVPRLRAVTLYLELDQVNLVHVEFIP